MKIRGLLLLALSLLMTLLGGIHVLADTYTYDPLNRLSRIAYSDDRSIDYTYDAAGNITRADRVGTLVQDVTPPITTVSPSPGNYSTSGAFMVQLTTNEPATIYYTTNGSSPTTLSTVYSGPVSVFGSITLKYSAKDSSGNIEPVKSAAYTVSANAKPVVTYPTKPAASTYIVQRIGGGSTTTVYSGPATTFTDTANLLPNTVYQYAVQSDTDPTQTIILTIRTSLYNGWNIIAVPYATIDINPEIFFGSAVSAIYEWIPAGTTAESSTTQLGSYTAVSNLTPGKGYFAKTSNSNTMLVYSGNPGPDSATVILKPGWTMIANPNTINKNNIGTNWLIDGDSLSQAINANTIGGGVYWWNGTTYDSWTVMGDNPEIEPWKGYWIVNLTNSDHILTIQ